MKSDRSSPICAAAAVRQMEDILFAFTVQYIADEGRLTDQKTGKTWHAFYTWLFLQGMG